ncbi:MAG: hypothetical protein ACYTFY_07975 [Planctomycetota bacterium]|jgi:predicted nucleotidyltransferase
MESNHPDFEEILRILSDNEVKFIIVGGISAVMQGAPITTYDLDILYQKTMDNIDNLYNALQKLDSSYRGRNDLKPTADHLEGDGHILLDTCHGQLDVLSFIGNNHTYEELVADSIDITVSGSNVKILNLSALIKSKEETAREKDLAMLPVLRSTLNQAQK